MENIFNKLNQLQPIDPNSEKQNLNVCRICKECDSKFSSKEGLKNHNNAINLKIKNFACQQCNCVTSIERRLDNHIKSIQSR